MKGNFPTYPVYEAIRKLMIFCIFVTFPIASSAENSEKEVSKDFTILAAKPEDYTLGDKNAKVVMVEYSSLSCPHCQYFHTGAFKKLKKEYIDTGKLLYVYRSFPSNRPALAGAKLAHCVEKPKFFAMLTTLFEAQSSWAFRNDYEDVLLNIAKLGDIPEEKFKACQNDKILEDSMLKVALESSKKLKFEGTPTFYINNEEVSGDRPYAVFKEIIEAKLKQQG